MQCLENRDQERKDTDHDLKRTLQPGERIIYGKCAKTKRNSESVGGMFHVTGMVR